MGNRYLIGGLVLIFLFLWLVPPFQQDVLYHQFADQNPLFFIPNWLNVLSNILFLIVGVMGVKLLSTTVVCADEIKVNYQVFFIGLILTFMGSSYYHLYPNNFTLIFDRLGMTISFIALLTAYLGEFYSLKLGRKMLIPLLIFGLFGVLYWGATEFFNEGDLRLYILTQYVPVLIFPILVSVKRWQYSHRRYCLFIFVFYALAKLAESYDQEIMNFLLGFSGHSLKHLLAAMSCYLVFWLLKYRKPL